MSESLLPLTVTFHDEKNKRVDYLVHAVREHNDNPDCTVFTVSGEGNNGSSLKKAQFPGNTEKLHELFLKIQSKGIKPMILDIDECRIPPYEPPAPDAPNPSF
jgi:hypothetical protein